MGRRLRNLILIALAGVAGALLGRYAARMHARIDAGEDPFEAEFDLDIRPQEVVPGLVAAFRVGEPPWSWLHIPGWLAAFGTNFAVAAVGGDLDRLRDTIEERVLGKLGLDSEREVEVYDVTPMEPAGASPEAPVAPEQPPASTRPTEPATNGHTSTVWTSENTAPSGDDPAETAGSETSGFTPFHD